MNNKDLDSLLKQRNDLCICLYARGFLYTSNVVNTFDYPFFDEWQCLDFGDGTIFVHPLQHCVVNKQNGVEQAIIGHAYNPFLRQSDEMQILNSLADNECNEFFDTFNQLTGVFTYLRIKDGKLTIIGDPSCMQTTFYYTDGREVLVSSHTNLIAQLKNLQWDPYIKRLTSYRLFKLLGNSLPGNLTQFAEVKRVVPNFEYRFENGNVIFKRFFTPHKQHLSNGEIVDKASEIMHKNLQLIAEKWQNPAISMTGGCDSKTTLACANGLYDRFSYFSYQSSDSEKVDADAAGRICNALGLQHRVYTIPDTNDQLKDVEETGILLRWNCGDIRSSNKNDVRKRAYFKEHFDYDVEVKSWASEIGRAYYSKRFHGRTNFGDKPTSRKMTTMYKFFFHDRRLVRDTDKVFKEYAESFFHQDGANPVEWQDQFFWEFRVPSWNGLVITGEHRYSFDITIPYNNRLLLNLLLSAPIEDRISDSIYKEIRTKMNARIDETGVAVQNLKHTKNREKLENIYYTIHSKIPF